MPTKTKRMPKTVKVGKRRYRWYDSHGTKRLADFQAMEQRQKGQLAVVRKGKAMSGIPVYRVYVRGKYK